MAAGPAAVGGIASQQREGQALAQLGPQASAATKICEA
jgi:hypothetical protein